MSAPDLPSSRKPAWRVRQKSRAGPASVVDEGSTYCDLAWTSRWVPSDKATPWLANRLPRSVVPALADSCVPRASAALRVMMLITPLTALAPQIDAPGPRTTSMRSTSSSGMSLNSQNTPEYTGEYRLRPSCSTSSLFA